MPFIWSTLIVFSAVSRYQPYSQPFQFPLQFEVYTQLNTFVTSASYLYQNFLYLYLTDIKKCAATLLPFGQQGGP